jgi:hypothetical protein
VALDRYLQGAGEWFALHQHSEENSPSSGGKDSQDRGEATVFDELMVCAEDSD